MEVPQKTKQSYHMIQQSHSWAYIQKRRKLQFKKIYTPQCSQQHYLQQPRHGSNLSVHQYMMDKEDVVYIQWNTTQP